MAQRPRCPATSAWKPRQALVIQPNAPPADGKHQRTSHRIVDTPPCRAKRPFGTLSDLIPATQDIGKRGRYASNMPESDKSATPAAVLGTGETGASPSGRLSQLRRCTGAVGGRRAAHRCGPQQGSDLATWLAPSISASGRTRTPRLLTSYWPLDKRRRWHPRNCRGGLFRGAPPASARSGAVARRPKVRCPLADASVSAISSGLGSRPIGRSGLQRRPGACAFRSPFCPDPPIPH